jgi:hypothetical protein
MTAAYVLERPMTGRKRGWMKGIDFLQEQLSGTGAMEQRVMELTAENERLQRIVAELLMRNQELRVLVERV